MLCMLYGLYGGYGDMEVKDLLFGSNRGHLYLPPASPFHGSLAKATQAPVVLFIR